MDYLHPNQYESSILYYDILDIFSCYEQSNSREKDNHGDDIVAQPCSQNNEIDENYKVSMTFFSLNESVITSKNSTR